MLTTLLLVMTLDAGVPVEGNMELHTPRLGQSTQPGERLQRGGPDGSAGGGAKRSGALTDEEPLAQKPAPLEERSTARWLLIGGGALVILALALTMGRKQPKDGGS